MRLFQQLTILQNTRASCKQKNFINESTGSDTFISSEAYLNQIRIIKKVQDRG